jgi:hypothetical protein
MNVAQTKRTLAAIEASGGLDQKSIDNPKKRACRQLVLDRQSTHRPRIGNDKSAYRQRSFANQIRV